MTYRYSRLDGDFLVKLFRYNAIPTISCFLTTRVLLIEIFFFANILIFLNPLTIFSLSKLQVLFKDTNSTRLCGSTISTYPEEYGLKSLIDVVKLKNIHSINFIMGN